MQCAYIDKNGHRCKKTAVEDSRHCEDHISPKNSLRSYLLHHVPLRESSARHAASEIASLRDEIAITRALIEERLNLITNNSELLVACGQVNSLMLTLERLIQTSVKTEEKLGELLSKTAVVEIATKIVGILSEELKGIEGYEVIVDTISERIGNVIEQTV